MKYIILFKTGILKFMGEKARGNGFQEAGKSPDN